MRKTLFSVIVVLVLVWSSIGVFAKRGAGGGREERVRGRDRQEEIKQERQEGRKEEKQQERKQERQKGEEKERQQKQVKEQEKVRQTTETSKGETGEKGAGKGREHQQQLRALEEQMVHEESKHLERVVRLSRIRELAGEENDVKAIERADKLLAKEQQRYERKRLDMEERKQGVLGFGERSRDKDVEKGAKEGTGEGKVKDTTGEDKK